MLLKTNGIVLRDYRIQEDRKLVILTEKAGVTEAWASGAGRPRSRLSASTELLCYSEFVLYVGKRRSTVDKAEANRIFFGIRSDLEKLALASYLAELTADLAPQEEEASAYLRLLLNTLHLLENGERSPLQLKALYELRLLTLAGYMPELVACRECGRYEADLMFFFPATGDLLCGNCGGDAPGGFRVGPGVLAALRHIVYSEAGKLFSFSLSEEGLQLLSRLCEDYLKYRMERTYPTLEFYHSLTAFPPFPSTGETQSP